MSGRDYGSERWIKDYTNQEPRDLMLTWQARAVRDEYRRKCDPAGVVETNAGVKGLAAVLRHFPLDVVTLAVDELVTSGHLEILPNTTGFIDPCHFEAQAKRGKADALIQSEWRSRRRAEALLGNLGRLPAVAGNPDADVSVPDADVSFPDKVLTRREEKKRGEEKRGEKVPRKRATPAACAAASGHQRVISRFCELYQAQTSLKYVVSPADGAHVKYLIDLHSADEVIGRMELLFSGKTWGIKPPYTIGTLRSQWNRIVVVAIAGGGGARPANMGSVQATAGDDAAEIVVGEQAL